jgi:hypothetical protein
MRRPKIETAEVDLIVMTSGDAPEYSACSAGGIIIRGMNAMAIGDTVDTTAAGTTMMTVGAGDMIAAGTTMMTVGAATEDATGTTTMTRADNQNA